MRVRFWGVRGSIPVPGPQTIRIGGNTACVDILTSDRQLIILDAGSGIRRLGQSLEAENARRIVGTLLISHTHYDHIQGFPYFRPAFARNNRFVVVGQRRVGPRLEEVLARQMIEPYLPFEYKALSADFHVKEVAHGETIVIGDETRVRAADMNHPGGCLGFRIENQGVVVAYCTDTMHAEGQVEPNVLELARDADLLIHDAHFTLQERETFAHWGHSSWREATRTAREANVKCLALFHFNPDTTDEYLENEILPKARQEFAQTILSREGLVLDLPLSDAAQRQLFDSPGRE